MLLAAKAGMRVGGQQISSQRFALPSPTKDFAPAAHLVADLESKRQKNISSYQITHYYLLCELRFCHLSLNRGGAKVGAGGKEGNIVQDSL